MRKEEITSWDGGNSTWGGQVRVFGTVPDVSVAAKLIDSSLTSSFRRNPRGGIEEEQYLLLVETIAPVILSNSSDRWDWTLDSTGDFLVMLARTLIDDSFLALVGNETR
nr:RNA-directed DNA polymerase, eukaryota [Tanacetum cinerariifolium]